MPFKIQTSIFEINIRRKILEIILGELVKISKAESRLRFIALISKINLSIINYQFLSLIGVMRKIRHIIRLFRV